MKYQSLSHLIQSSKPIKRFDNRGLNLAYAQLRSNTTTLDKIDTYLDGKGIRSVKRHANGRFVLCCHTTEKQMLSIRPLDMEYALGRDSTEHVINEAILQPITTEVIEDFRILIEPYVPSLADVKKRALEGLSISCWKDVWYSTIDHLLQDGHEPRDSTDANIGIAFYISNSKKLVELDDVQIADLEKGNVSIAAYFIDSGAINYSRTRPTSLPTNSLQKQLFPNVLTGNLIGTYTRDEINNIRQRSPKSNAVIDLLEQVENGLYKSDVAINILTHLQRLELKEHEINMYIDNIQSR